ncbi:fimbria/pilus periplasmic chaperone [Salmonella enterica subsp. enterica serovar Montevideo]
MNFKDTLPGVFLCVAMFACGHARANMLVYPMAAEINSSREEATSLFVYSKSDHVQYIRTRIMRIEHPGMPQEKEVPAGNDIETGLVVSPEKFALSPGTKKTIRVISTQAPEREEAWRVYFEAVPELEDDPQAGGKQNSSVSVNLVWGGVAACFSVRPQACAGNERSPPAEYGKYPAFSYSGRQLRHHMPLAEYRQKYLSRREC